MKVALSIVAILLAARGTAQTPGQWPCPDPRPAAPSLAALWPQAKAERWRDDAAVSALVMAVAPRSVEEKQAISQIQQFAARSDSRTTTMPKVAAGLVEVIGAEQETTVHGIERFNERQAQLARRMQNAYGKLDSQPGEEGPEDAKTAALREQTEWDTRMFEDRQRLLPIMCKLPASLAARLETLVRTARDSAR